MDAVSEIKARIQVQDLVSQYVQLKKVGRNFKALCPFHKERTPSFHVSVERQIAYCFGCRKGGDIFKFIEEIEGLDFRGALQFLAERAGVTLPKAAPHERERKTERDRLVELHEKSTAYFEDQLWDTDDGKKVLQYLKKRGLKEETIKSARLGFAPAKGDALYTYLLEKSFTRSEILASGLAIARDIDQGSSSSQGVIDRFRTRLMFPIQNLAGQICAYGGRAIRDGDEPKYLNSPETPIYHKSSLLYGLSNARPEIREKKNAIIVEGYMDALAAVQAGYKNVIACSGTALTENQLALLKRFTNEVVFSFDRDNAGKAATARAIELGFAQEFMMKVVVWDGEAKDPDECLRKSPKIFAKAVESAAPVTDYLLTYLKGIYDITFIDGKKKMLADLLPFFSRVKSPMELDEWLKKSASVLESSVQSLYDELKRFQGKQKTLSNPNIKHAADDGIAPAPSFKIQEYLLGLLLTYPEACSKINLLVPPEDFEDIELQNIYRFATTQYNQALGNQTFRPSQSSAKILMPSQGGATLSPKELERKDILAVYTESKFGDMNWDAVECEVTETVLALIKQKFNRQKKSLLAKLKGATGGEREGLLESYQELLAKEEKSVRETGFQK